LSCSQQLDSQVMSFITRLWPRRLGLVDEQKGLVYSFPMFQHRGAVHDIKIKGVPGVDVLAHERWNLQYADGGDF
jgi:hypothetical protein